MNRQDLKKRTKHFTVDAIRCVNALPKSKANDVISYQALKSAASGAANYRASLRGRSLAEFISKPGAVPEYVDGSMFWFESSEGTNEKPNKNIVKTWHKKSGELTALVTAPLKAARKKSEPKNLTSHLLNLTSIC